MHQFHCLNHSQSIFGDDLSVCSVLLTLLVKRTHGDQVRQESRAGVSLNVNRETAGSPVFVPRDRLEVDQMLDWRFCIEALCRLGEPPLPYLLK